MKLIEILVQNRRLVAKAVEGLSADHMLTIPDGYKNNVLWNLGHIVVTQQLLHYGLAKQPMNISQELVKALRKGSSPSDWTTPPDFKEIRALLFELPERMKEDYRQGRFADFDEYTTSTGVVLKDIDDALIFNHFHEGFHTGVIQSLRKKL